MTNLADLSQWNRQHYFDNDGWSLSVEEADREYQIIPWTTPTGCFGYFLKVNKPAQDSQHEITNLGKELPTQLMPSHLYRTRAAASRAAQRHNAKSC